MFGHDFIVSTSATAATAVKIATITASAGAYCCFGYAVIQIASYHAHYSFPHFPYSTATTAASARIGAVMNCTVHQRKVVEHLDCFDWAQKCARQ